MVIKTRLAVVVMCEFNAMKYFCGQYFHSRVQMFPTLNDVDLFTSEPKFLNIKMTYCKCRLTPKLYRTSSEVSREFSARCYTRRAQYCYGKSPVCLSVRDVEVSRSHRFRFFKNSRLVSLGCSLFADPNNTDLLQGEHPELKFWPE